MSKDSKNKQKLVMITAYDAMFAKLFEEFADIILVGDSLNMSFNGNNDTLNITIQEMIYHTKAVCRGARDSFIVCDLPFGTYYDKKTALKNSIKVYRDTTADAVKLEGGKEVQHIVKYLTQNAIAVVGHIGLMPQSVRLEGGYKVKGKNPNEIKKLIEDAQALEKAGIFLLIVEGVKADEVKEITQNVKIPVIGIGAGKDTDGQVLVWSDMLGFFDQFKPKFARRYLDGASLVKQSVQSFANDVKNGTFPSNDESY